jgi:type I restriction enzyme S subunit
MKNGNQDFLYYMMKYYMPHLINKESGTVFGSVNRNDINGLEVDIPSDAVIQRRIARYLAMIDDKIELNTAINKNLRLISSRAKRNCHRPLGACSHKDEWRLRFIGRQPDSEQLCCERSVAA